MPFNMFRGRRTPQPEWGLRRLTDYWDEQVQAIDQLSRRLASVPEAQRPPQIEAIREAVVARSRALNEKQLALAAFCVMDDLYKAVSVLSYWDKPLEQYLATSVGALSSVLSERGYTLRYVVNNTFELTPSGMNGPLEWFPVWFQAAGISYICPQHMARLLMRHDECPEQQYFAQLPRYIQEARLVSRDAVRRCEGENVHYFYLDADAESDSFDFVQETIDTPGLISIIRSDPPLPGSTATLRLPATNRRGLPCGP